MKKEDEKGFVTFEEMMVAYGESPKDSFLWGGVKEKSFGLVFGPSKSGKTIFCENLAMKLATGSSRYFGNDLPGVPKKVLFVGLEEFWKSRAERNKKQFDALNSEEQLLINENYRYQAMDFPRHIVKDENWEKLSEDIEKSEAEVVFIDSITRLNHGKMEDSKTAEEILSKLREICYTQSITLICIHHTPKMNGRMLTMDCIKGSSVFAQESDFAIGVNKSPTGMRYVKNVFYRYAPDDDETVKEFFIDDDIWLRFASNIEETLLFQSQDGREKPEVKDFIVEYFNSKPDSTKKTAEVLEYLTANLGLRERQIKKHLSNLVTEGRLKRPVTGYYTSVTGSVEGGGENA